MLKAIKFLTTLALFESVILLPCFILSGSLLWPLLGLNLVLFSALVCAPRLFMGQIHGKMASSSTHFEDYLILETISKQLRVQSPKIYIYHSEQINSYLLKGPFGRATLAVSSECFSSLSLEERGILYRYHMTRMLFPLHLYLDTGLSLLSLCLIGAIDVLFLPLNILRRGMPKAGKSDLQQAFKLAALPLLNFCQNFVLGSKKHSYIKSVFINNVSREHFMPLYFKARQLLMKAPLEYDFLSCNGFMGFKNDLFTVLTEKHNLQDYMWKQD
ncbi:MAG: hypothetical protein OXB88_09055 [Bacteriovoracales bacterium]|nr:hypothetical protein [Bacteriovoracales bacterium]